jgi:hypothetical protein
VSAAVLGAGLLVTGCSQVKMGAAALVGDQRITIATLDSQAANLSQAAKRYPGVFRLTPEQATQETLTWLIRFQINEQLARQAGITVSRGQAQKALSRVYAMAKAEAQAQGLSSVSLDLVLVASGIPPGMSEEAGRYQAIQDQFIARANGGTAPTTGSAQTATTAKLQRAQCLAAKSLKIQVNPQFGRWDYAKYEVVPAPSKVTRTPGPAKPPSLSGLTPAC